jgi:hypothetical protein
MVKVAAQYDAESKPGAEEFFFKVSQGSLSGNLFK